MIKGRKLNKFAISLPWVCGFENDNYSLSDKILLFGEEWLDYIRLVPQPVGYLPKNGAGKMLLVTFSRACSGFNC